MKFLDSQLEQFMIESNEIEMECGLNPNDVMVMKMVVGNGLKTEDQLLEYHRLLTDHLNVRWSGKYRDCNVVVGNSTPPDASSLPYRMAEFFERLPKLTAWEAHNVFECIHPFQDFNGRTGRLLWLAKALGEMRNPFSVPFLQTYYYQTLTHWGGLG